MADPIEDKPRDFPFDAMVRQAQELVRMQNMDVWQRFYCSGCGDRQQVDEPNVFHEERACSKCGHINDIKAQGCNYMVRMIIQVGGKPEPREVDDEGSDGNDPNALR